MITLVLGGTRSGKSAVAERIAAGLAAREAAIATGSDSDTAAGVRRARVTYVATAVPAPDDLDHLARIARHRARRPDAWTTIECSTADLAVVVGGTAGVVLVDSLGTWVAHHLDLQIDTEAIVAALASRRDPMVVVSEEVGLSVHPPSELGRRFIDVLGELNQRVSAIADRVLFVVAGRVIDLSAPPQIAELGPDPGQLGRHAAEPPPPC